MKYILRLFILLMIHIHLSQAESLVRDDSTNIVYDYNTLLYWQDFKINHAGSLTYGITFCEALPFYGYDDWRLPNVNELLSLVDYSKSNPSIKGDTFVNFRSQSYWTSTSLVEGKLYQTVSFMFGEISSIDKNTSVSAGIKCVRGGPLVKAPKLTTQAITLNTSEITPIVFNTIGALNSCDIANLPLGLSKSIKENKCIITGRPLKASNPLINIKVSNASGEHNISIQMTVNLLKPNMENKSETNAILRTSIIPIIFNNLAGNPSSCSATNLPSGLSVDVNGGTCAITGSPIIKASKKTITITATNFKGSNTATIDISVNGVGIGNLRTGKLSSVNDKDDGYYKRGLGRDFTRDSDKKVVLDKITNLMWQDDSTDNNNTYSGANTYCDDLNLSGFSNWKLPSIQELNTIVDRGRANIAINSIFKNALNKWYWSKTIHQGHLDSAWSVYFYTGQATYVTKINSSIHIRCVRDNQ